MNGVAWCSKANTEVKDWASTWRAKDEKRDHFGGWLRHSSLSFDSCREQATHAGLRQTHDLLSSVDPDAGRNQADSCDHHSSRPGRLSVSACRRKTVGAGNPVCDPASARGDCTSLYHWKRLSGSGLCCLGVGR